MTAYWCFKIAILLSVGQVFFFAKLFCDPDETHQLNYEK